MNLIPKKLNPRRTKSTSKTQNPQNIHKSNRRHAGENHRQLHVEEVRGQLGGGVELLPPHQGGK
ncbi:Os09g0247101 [Oryza sativa Japonica Group]|uniref:Uncharacterized protein n=2 Tax=Oryza sativa subsp. japonica TaxID=39947 RepID=Q6H5K9_ORYSJ|nr:hypothetical protein EE612_046286 [Oryza sativa]BAD23387.1 hypothetical protein [Oryza sativa Japonica Group]BAD25990.1 hypothetical protein [Oryza sativa Japonica Group]BAT07017.1 Os09g0247101 [Oryza sativa Japonica Group]